MTEASITNLTQAELEQLQRLRVSVLAFQSIIGSLPADEQSNAHNEQFNQLRREAKAILKGPSSFDKKVVRAITEEALAERSQKMVLPRLSVIVVLGVILALLGLGLNSVVLETPVVNTLACCVSSGGMLLIVAAFGVLGVTSMRRRLSNFGDLYQRCEALLYQINHALNMAVPGFTDQAAVNVPPTPSVVEMVLDSLKQQAAYWAHQLKILEKQRHNLGSNAPLDLVVTIDFVQRELNRIQQETDRLHGQVTLAPESEEIAAHQESMAASRKKEVASSTTIGMSTLENTHSEAEEAS